MFGSGPGSGDGEAGGYPIDHVPLDMYMDSDDSDDVPPAAMTPPASASSDPVDHGLDFEWSPMPKSMIAPKKVGGTTLSSSASSSGDVSSDNDSDTDDAGGSRAKIVLRQTSWLPG